MVDHHPPAITGLPRIWLRLEGLAAFVAGLALYAAVGGEWLWALPLLLVPDVSMVGYLFGPARGAMAYNLVHNWALAIVLFALGFWLSSPPLGLAGSVLIAHVGVDRLMGYGLKYPTDFGDTHLGRIGRR